MKRILFILFAALTLAACQKEEAEKPTPIKCELDIKTITLPSEGGTFIVKTNVPSFVGMYGYGAIPGTDQQSIGFATGVKDLPTKFPKIYEPKGIQIPPSYREYFYGSYRIIQTDATTSEVSVWLPEEYNSVSFRFIPEGCYTFPHSKLDDYLIVKIDK